MNIEVVKQHEISGQSIKVFLYDTEEVHEFFFIHNLLGNAYYAQMDRYHNFFRQFRGRDYTTMRYGHGKYSGSHFVVERSTDYDATREYTWMPS